MGKRKETRREDQALITMILAPPSSRGRLVPSWDGFLNLDAAAPDFRPGGGTIEVGSAVWDYGEDGTLLSAEMLPSKQTNEAPSLPWVVGKKRQADLRLTKETIEGDWDLLREAVRRDEDGRRILIQYATPSGEPVAVELSEHAIAWVEMLRRGDATRPTLWRFLGFLMDLPL